MSTAAREFFLKNVALKSVRTAPVTRAQAYSVDYLHTPVNVETFIEDPYYLGRILHGNIFEKLKADLIELFDGKYSEVLLTGAIGWGKSVMAEIGIAYDLYRVSCLRSPADAYGLLPGGSLAFLTVSVQKAQAIKVLFGGLGNLMRNSPYFREKFPYDARITSELRFPRSIFAYPVAASEQAILGEGVFSAAFDEMNFYAVVQKSKQHPEGGTYDQAVQLYNRMSRRLKSRMNQRGLLPGHLWMISSARYPNDFTERKSAEALTDKTIFVRQYNAWETKPTRFFMSESFKVEVGDVTRQSRVLTGSETDVNQDRVMEVPMDFKDAFDKDPDGAARDHGGVSVLSIRPFFGRRDLVNEMMQNAQALGLRHPFSDYSVTLQSEHERLLPEFLDWVTDEDGKKHIANGPYYAHIDLALSGDAAGIGIAHVTGSRQVTRGFGPDRKFETKPIVRVDLALEIIQPPRGEIRISSIRELLYMLRDLGMQFGIVSYDAWGSEESIQTLKNEGFSAELLSVDKDPAPYEATKECVYDGRLVCYYHPILLMEFSTVRKDDKTGKIDHPPHGKKDILDGVVGAVWQAEKGWAGGATSPWGGVTAVQPDVHFGFEDENAMLWDKVNRGIPLNEDEIKKIH